MDAREPEEPRPTVGAPVRAALPRPMRALALPIGFSLLMVVVFGTLAVVWRGPVVLVMVGLLLSLV